MTSELGKLRRRLNVINRRFRYADRWPECWAVEIAKIDEIITEAMVSMVQADGFERINSDQLSAFKKDTAVRIVYPI